MSETTQIYVQNNSSQHFNYPARGAQLQIAPETLSGPFEVPADSLELIKADFAGHPYVQFVDGETGDALRAEAVKAEAKPAEAAQEEVPTEDEPKGGETEPPAQGEAETPKAEVKASKRGAAKAAEAN